MVFWAIFSVLVFHNFGVFGQEQPADPPPEPKPGRVEDSVFIVKTGSGMGTAFLLQETNGLFLVSNLHVIAAPPPLEIYDTEGRRLKLGRLVEVAKGVDLVRFRQETGTGLEVSAPPKLGDPAVSYGNSGGGNVITENPGKVLGVGPQTFEVSCEIVQGNSGGPIVSSERRVVGVASFLVKQDNDWNANTRYDEIRRFGIRLDQPLVWEKVAIPELQNEAGAFQAMVSSIMIIAETMKGMTGTSSLMKAELSPGLPFPQKAQRNFDQAVNYYNKNLITARNKQSARLGFKQVFTHLNESLESLVEDQKPVFRSSWGIRQYEELAGRCRELSKKMIEQRDAVVKSF